jgi:hypothetical protein
MVAAQGNHISKLDANQKATETKLETKVWSAELAEKKNCFPLGSGEWQYN